MIMMDEASKRMMNEWMLFLPQEVCAAGQRRCPYLFPRLREARCKRRGVPRIGTRRRQAPRRAAGGNGELGAKRVNIVYKQHVWAFFPGNSYRKITLLRREWSEKDPPTTGLFIINGGRNSYDPVEILAKKLRKLNETNILVITILESQKLS